MEEKNKNLVIYTRKVLRTPNTAVSISWKCTQNSWYILHQLKKGYKIIYDPAPSVFHHHGVGHSNNTSRIKYIRNILTGFKISKKAKKVICMIPILKPVKLKNRFLILLPSQ